jgi:hypothetical protein
MQRRLFIKSYTPTITKKNFFPRARLHVNWKYTWKNSFIAEYTSNHINILFPLVLYSGPLVHHRCLFWQGCEDSYAKSLCPCRPPFPCTAIRRRKCSLYFSVWVTQTGKIHRLVEYYWDKCTLLIFYKCCWWTSFCNFCINIFCEKDTRILKIHTVTSWVLEVSGNLWKCSYHICIL